MSLKDFQRIPGVGKVVANDLFEMGYKSVAELKDQNPEVMYVLHNTLKAEVQDICMLYTFRCAVYFANTENSVQDKEKLKWWNWMDKERISSKEKHEELKAMLNL